MDNRLAFPQLTDKSFLHPTDAIALKAVQKLKGLDILINKMNQVGFEKIKRIEWMGDNIKVTKQTYSSIYKKVELCAKVLNLPMPDVFINQDPNVNAFATGTDAPMIQINSGLIELMNDEELLAVIAHEMGHIKCDHVLYQTIAEFIKEATSWIGPLRIITKPMVLTIYEWSRKSELSADRAALLVSQDVKPVINLLLKLAGGTKKFVDLIDYDDFLQQSIQYKEMAKGLSGKTFKFLLTVAREHPFPVMRAAEIEEWSRNKEYKDIVKNGISLKKYTMSFDNTPKNLKAKKGQKRAITLIWDIANSTNISGYNIYKSLSKSGEYKLIKRLTSRQANSFTDNKLMDGKTYFYYIKSLDLYNTEGKRTSIAFAETKSIPKAITKISAKRNLIRRIDLSWNLPSDTNQKSKLNIYRSNDKNDSFNKITSLKATQTKYSDKKLKDGMSYHYYITIDVEGLLSVPSKTAFAKTKPLPEAPGNLKINHSTRSTNLKWNSVKDASTYSIFIKQMIKDKKIATTYKAGYTYPSKVKKGNKVTFYVRSVDKDSRESDKSNEVTFKS